MFNDVLSILIKYTTEYGEAVREKSPRLFYSHPILTLFKYSFIYLCFVVRSTIVVRYYSYWSFEIASCQLMYNWVTDYMYVSTLLRLCILVMLFSLHRKKRIFVILLFPIRIMRTVEIQNITSEYEGIVKNKTNYGRKFFQESEWCNFLSTIVDIKFTVESTYSSSVSLWICPF